MTDIMVHDVTNPPLAARFFSYACLAGYEVVAQNDSASPNMHGILNKYPQIEKPAVTGYSYQLSALLAMMETAKKMQPSGTLLDKYEQQFLYSCRQQGISEEVITASLNYAQAISKNMLAYAKADKYNRISNYPRYTPSNQDGTWYPTPPGYFAPVEPYFNTIRSFTLDTCVQFKPAPPVAFSTDKTSAFFKLMQECYQEGVDLPKDHREVAAFWDCNPFALQDNGHMLVGMKKISPGAHWLGITGIACQQAQVPFAKAMQINTLVSISLMDGFLACWDEKFRSNRIRPETAIRKYIDPQWKPLLQTPPFPEYLSGHSTISSAAAVVLTHYLGDNFKYIDTVEVRFGLPAREFKSFQQAADEAGISRFYGGIHFRDAIDNGRLQGLQVGEWVVNKVNKKPGTLAAAKTK
ncbi:phosphatase PAP2 family protein [Adhaeribacter swui]|uniref:Phosphatase PAP2 family protein n=2 Tax=Adhaeribacter swui TaxID=2086471 RepID=A0A7G7GFM3_9BACT|nr:phosphatase PAP2 family protein [Adhaeribacter swui]